MPVGAFLYDFKQMDQVIEIESAVLGETIALVSNRKCLPAVTPGVVPYLPDEMAYLLDKSDETARQVYELKKRFDGEVIASEPLKKNKWWRKLKGSGV